MEVRYVQHVVGTKAVSVDDTVGLDLVLNDSQKRFCGRVWDHNDIDLSTSFEQPKDGNLAYRLSTFFAFSTPPK